MSEALYVAGEFYGIQKYVLGITAAGGGQAKRLRARSFAVQAMEDVVLADLAAIGRYDPVMSGGGQFVVRMEDTPALRERLAGFRTGLQRRLLYDLGGELSFNLGWAESVEGARAARSAERRRPWAGVMTGAAGWKVEAMSRDDIAPPCEICRKRKATKDSADEPPERVCGRCFGDRRIGEKIPRARGVEPVDGDGDIRLLGRGIRLTERQGEGRRPMYRYVPFRQDGGRDIALTFEEMAGQAQGDEVLGVLKADVDDFGKLIAAHMEPDKLDKLRTISEDLDRFFSVTVQGLIRGSKTWEAIYTIFSGGDDLLLVGPWNVMLDFASTLEGEFRKGPGGQYVRTLSAAVSFMPPRIPIRHGVKRAEDQLKDAKNAGKDRCATLGGVWTWEDLRKVLGAGVQLVKWWNGGAMRKAPLRRLHRIAASKEPSAHLWAWEVGRNFPSRYDRDPERGLFREWGERVLAGWEGKSMEETRAALLYALTATRRRSKDEQRDHRDQDARGRRVRG
jgi:CRISPR-associated protein Csm1